MVEQNLMYCHSYKNNKCIAIVTKINIIEKDIFDNCPIKKKKITYLHNKILLAKV